MLFSDWVDLNMGALSFGTFSSTHISHSLSTHDSQRKMDMPAGTISTILKDSIMVYGNWIEIWFVLFLLFLNDCHAVMLCLCSTYIRACIGFDI
jgi:hypothetical protein